MNDVHLNYFPHKDACPQDGRPCLGEKCKYWLGDKRCWDVEFGEIVKETFDTDYDYIYFKDENDRHIEGIRCAHFGMAVSERTKPEEIIPIYVSIGFNSHRLAEKVQEKFKLIDWEIMSRSEDGGDDTDLEKIIDGRYEKKEEILDMLFFVRDIIPEIVQFEKDINTCAVCRDKCEALTEYAGRAICGGCERRIILENLEKYISA